LANNFQKKFRLNISVCANHNGVTVEEIKDFPVSKQNNPLLDDFILNAEQNKDVLLPYICDRWDASFIISNEHHVSSDDIKVSIETIMQYMLKTFRQQVNHYAPEEIINIINDMMGATFVTAYKSEGTHKALGVEYLDETISPFCLILNFEDPDVPEYGN